MDELGVVHIDDDMPIESVCLQLRNGERTVEIGELDDPEPGRYVLAREVAD